MLIGDELCERRRVKIATWNCNSIRAREHRLLPWLEERKPDIVCLQELKCEEAEVPVAALEALGYRAALHCQKTYNGVAILARSEPKDVVRGLSDGVDDSHARLIAGTVDGLRVVCAYAPNGQEVGSPAYQYKLEWFARLRRYIDARHKPNQALILCGDWNVAPEPIDVHDPVAWEGQTLYSQPEREALKQVMEFGLVDLFRAKHPGDGRFTWWDYRQLSFPKNEGLRIDHLLATEAVATRVTEVEIDREMRKGKQPSDHAPVWAELSET